MSAIIKTYSGTWFDLADPKPNHVNIVDIAVALSRINRFNGHTIRPYTVAQHSVHCAQMLPPGLQLQGLMHDATEAYIGDLTRPLKNLIGVIIKEIEQRVWLAIARKYHLPAELHADVKRIDDLMLSKEQSALQHNGTGEMKIWHEDLAMHRFMEAFHDFGGKDEKTA
jgi:uncharacterized protein